MSAASSPVHSLPAHVDSEGFHQEPVLGITMRQHYAGISLGGILASSPAWSPPEAPRVAAIAWAMADAMLVAEAKLGPAPDTCAHDWAQDAITRESVCRRCGVQVPF